jgi:hypothetical protein
MTSGVAVACATGGFKSVFLHGVLAALEEAGFRADAYGAGSSSVLPAAAAAVGRAGELGLEFWEAGLEVLGRPGRGMSQMALAGIEREGPRLRRELFCPGRPRLMVATNAVAEPAVEETLGRAGRRRGRLLLLDAARGERAWIDQNLTLELFDTQAEGPLRLSEANFDQVAYASSRMLHAWDTPAWVDGRAYVDAYYTCNCPAHELAELGYAIVLALSNEPVLYRDIFRSERVATSWGGGIIEVIAPDRDPAELGVDYTRATAIGLGQVYRHGLETGRAFLDQTAARKGFYP